MVIQSLFLLAAGFVLLVKGADWFVEGAAMIAEKLGIPELVIGLTIVAMGTSMPEAAVSITAALDNNAGVAIGNVVGSNIVNILLILGMTAAITSIRVQKATIRYEIPFLLLVTMLLILLGKTGSAISMYEGIVLWVLFLLYLAYLFIMAKRGESNPAEDGHPMDRPVWQCVIIMFLTGIMIIKGSDFVVTGAKDIAEIIGLSDRIIGLTIVAIGTSLPELVTCLAAALKGKADLAIGNIVGSNIFNILFILGTASIITPIPFENKFFADVAVCILAVGLLWLGSFWHRELRRRTGVFMMSVYAAYLALIIMC